MSSFTPMVLPQAPLQTPQQAPQQAPQQTPQQTSQQEARPPEPRSSPPQRDGDDDVNLRRYFNWLSSIYPTHRATLLEIMELVAKEGWGFSDLRACSEDEWKAMGVGGGFRVKIRKHLKDWASIGNSPEGSQDSNEGLEER